MHEGGIATPMIVRWPERIAPNTVTQQMGHVMDFMPTFLELAGASYPSTYRGQSLIPLEGRSLLPVFHGRDMGWIPDLKWAYRGCRAIRQGDWKLVWDKAFKQWELYHLVHDRTEMTDLSLQYPDRVQAMAESWDFWAVHLGIEGPSLQ
jgi:arylsulfatase